MTDPSQGWQIRRSERRNHHFKITNVVGSAIFSNSVLGQALNLNANLIITLYPFLSEIPAHTDDLEAIELMYKHEIFLYSLGTDWIFSSKNGRFLVSTVFNVEFVDVVSMAQKNVGIFLQYELDIPLVALIQKFPHSVILNHDTQSHIVKNIYVLNQYLPLKSLIQLDLDYVDTIITFNLYPDLQIIATRYRLNLIWLDKVSFLEEICRELIHQLNKQLRNHIQYMEIPRSRKINGLDGI